MNFRPVRNVVAAEFIPEDIFAGHRKATGARAAGLRYERKAHAFLLAKYPSTYVPGSFIKYRENRGSWQFCQPDGFLYDPRRGRITVIEMKLRHCELSWWQLFHLYGPVLRFIFGDKYDYTHVELCAWFEPNIQTSQQPFMIPNLEAAKPNAWNVHICNL